MMHSKYTIIQKRNLHVRTKYIRIHKSTLEYNTTIELNIENNRGRSGVEYSTVLHTRLQCYTVEYSVEQ